MALMALLFFLFLKPIIAIWLNAERILLLLNQEAEVAHLAGIYLRWVTLSLPGYTFNNISRYVPHFSSLFHPPHHLGFFLDAISNPKVVSPSLPASSSS